MILISTCSPTGTMILINYLSFLILSLLLAISSIDGKRFERNKHDKKVLARSKFEKLAFAAQQLVIVSPSNGSTLIANTTSKILIDSQSLAKAVNAVPITTTFNCNGVLFFVDSVLGVPADYTVDPRISSTCSIQSEAPLNPDLFVPSVPSVLTILNPLYFEGTTETAFHTAEILPIYVRPSDNATLSINFVITCGSVVKSIPIITSTSTLNYVLTPDLVGDCTFTTPNVPVGYIPIEPVSVTISPSIFFVTPPHNAQYPPQSTISATLTATDGNSNLSVTVELTCEGNIVETKTQNIISTFSFAPSNQIYGICVLSLADVAGYYTEETVTVAYKSILSFVLPNSGAVVPQGSKYDIQVDGTSGTSSVSVTVVVKCQVGGTFTEIVPLGVKTQATLGLQYQGLCTLVATTSTPYFTPATTTTYISASELVITSPIADSVQYVGVPFNLTVSASPAGQTTQFNATFTDAFGNSYSIDNLPVNMANSVILDKNNGLIGSISLVVTSVEEPGLVSSPLLFILYSTLYFTDLASSITYGQPLVLNIATSSPYPVQYTASFACSSGSYQITGLTTGKPYSIVPAGIYGQVVITVSATNTSPATGKMSIFKPSSNIPPAFIPGRLPFYPSVYANMKNGKDLEIVSVEYLKSAPI